uniref:Uncharacterized protein n=1 Tax=Plectus sambesii TaxID=2011161 RepID=A0A914X271_9BILA
MVINIVGFGVICTCLNDKSRAILFVLHSTTPSQQNHYWLDAFHRKIADNSWGLTIGKLLLLERTACLGIISAIITFVAFYAQFSESASVQKYNGTVYNLDEFFGI